MEEEYNIKKYITYLCMLDEFENECLNTKM